jgi:hypothetical protein
MRPSSFHTNRAISRYGLAGTHLCPTGFRDGSPLRRTQGYDNLHIGHTCPILGRELKTGTLHAMCKQLRIRKDEL